VVRRDEGDSGVFIWILDLACELFNYVLAKVTIRLPHWRSIGVRALSQNRIVPINYDRGLRL
jgi:hypothetical protein